MNGIFPDLTFACELEAQPLQELFARPDVLDFLQATHSTVSLGILDLSEQRAEVIQFLNQAEVPVTAWLLLPKDQGYWFNLDNYPQALARYDNFKRWSDEHGLQWARIGLDIEPDLREMKTLTAHRWTGAQRMLRRSFNNLRLRSGKRAYHSLIEQIHADGYKVETYQIPFIVDERIAGSNLLQRTTGMVNLPEADREVLMLYSSFMRPWGQGILWSYAPDAQGIGVGITGKGMEQETSRDVQPLNWSELETDLLLARRHCENLFIFSLEGCVQQNFLPLLRSLDWAQNVEIPYTSAQRAENIRKPIQQALWLSARPAWLLFGAAMLVSLVTLLTRRSRD